MNIEYFQNKWNGSKFIFQSKNNFKRWESKIHAEICYVGVVQMVIGFYRERFINYLMQQEEDFRSCVLFVSERNGGRGSSCVFTLQTMKE